MLFICVGKLVPFGNLVLKSKTQMEKKNEMEIYKKVEGVMIPPTQESILLWSYAYIALSNVLNSFRPYAYTHSFSFGCLVY